jgi:hypothetical protein
MRPNFQVSRVTAVEQARTIAFLLMRCFGSYARVPHGAICRLP